MAESKPTTVDVRVCTCKHEFQDKHYKGLRLHNRSPSTSSPKSGAPRWRCTVCGSLK